MPRTQSGLVYPKKGSPEAKAWGEKMRALRKSKKRGKKKRRKKTNPGTRWHLQHAAIQRSFADKSTGMSRRYHEGGQRAHLQSAVAAHRLGINPRKKPRRKVKKNPGIAIYNRARTLRWFPDKKLYDRVHEILADRFEGTHAGLFGHKFNTKAAIFAAEGGALVIIPVR